MTLLTVDWDYFFPVPDPTKPNPYHSLYDWAMAESPLYINALWAIRGSSFLANDLPLPTVDDEWYRFWDRFNIRADATCYFSDSHLFAGTADVMFSTDRKGHQEIWLYDAHHDSGYNITLGQFIRSGRMDCSNWMMNYLINKRRHRDLSLHVRYPAWKAWAIECEPQPAIPKLDRQMDDGTNPDVEFDTVHVCRSSAWVPPWCDEAFMQFVQSCPVEEINELQELPERDTTGMEEMAAITKDHLARR